MPIQIIRNEHGNCIEFRGSSHPVYWNACLQGEVDSELTDTVNVLNQVSGEYEFYHIPFETFRDEGNSPFASPSDVADYITSKGNVLSVDGSSYLGAWDADTNTPELSDADTPLVGDFYYVSVEGSTLLGGIDSWRRHDKVIWSGTVWERLAARTIVGASTRSVLLSTNLSTFADGEHAKTDPTSLTAGWYYKNTENNKINWYFYGNPDLDHTLGDFGGSYAVVDFRSTDSAPFWSIYTRIQGDGQDQGWYRSRINYSDYSTLQAKLNAEGAGRYIIYTSGLDVSSVEPSIPASHRFQLPIDATTTVGLQEDSEELYLMSLSTSSNRPEGSEEFVVEYVGYKMGDYFQEFTLSSPPTVGASIGDTTPDSLDFRIDATNTTILVDDGTQYGVNSVVAVGNGNGTVNILSIPGDQIVYENLDFNLLTILEGNSYTTENGAVNALNALFQVQPLGSGGDYDPVYPVLDLAPVTENYEEGTNPVTNLSDGTTPHKLTASGTTGHDARFWSTETIDTAGEFYTVRIAGEGRFILGLGSVADGDLTEMQSDSGGAHSGLIWGNAFYNYSGNIRPWTYYGSSAAGVTRDGWTGPPEKLMGNNTSVQTELDSDANLKDGALFKVGIDAQGYISVWYYDEGRSNDFIMTARRSLTTAAGDYFLVVKLWDGNATITQTPERSAVDPTAPVLDYHFIESPDGVFSHPLFTTQEEANYVDAANGGAGTSHAHIYPDDPTATSWYMPDTGGNMSGTSAPANTDTVIWDEIPTLADAQFAPSAFDISDITVDEGASTNIQVAPQDAGSYTTSVQGLPTGMQFDGWTTIQGYAPAVASDNVSNPSDDYVITVTRSNAYGSTVDTFQLTVNNLTAPQTEISGLQLVSGGYVDSDTLGANGVVYLDADLSDGDRMIIPTSWVESYVLPAVNAGGTVRLGVPASSADWSTFEDSDYDAYIRWSPQSWYSHESVLETPNAYSMYGIGSLSSAVFDYGFEYDAPNLHLIACNVNALNTEPSVNSGGQFTRVATWVNSVPNNGQNFRFYLSTTADMDISASGVNTLSIPTPPAPPILTSWSKALDFGGSAERTQQVSVSTDRAPIKMSSLSTTVSSNAFSGLTSAASNARPWATSIVFKSVGDSSNQHIWNLGEGSSSHDDNIYLRTDSNKDLIFGWGRSGAVNECVIGNISASLGSWHAVYIAHTGERLSGADATAEGLSDCFDIRVTSNQSAWAVGTNKSLAAGWTTTGGRMDRSFSGDMTIGGRGANRSFKGKVAAMVVTTLRVDEPMPDDSEIEMMIKDPVRWLSDYKESSWYRRTDSTQESIWSLNNHYSESATQVWLMGDGPSDGYAQIRNHAHPANQNYTPMNMISMVSNDIVSVTIGGLTN